MYFSPRTLAPTHRITSEAPHSLQTTSLVVKNLKIFSDKNQLSNHFLLPFCLGEAWRRQCQQLGAECLVAIFKVGPDHQLQE